MLWPNGRSRARIPKRVVVELVARMGRSPKRWPFGKHKSSRHTRGDGAPLARRVSRAANLYRARIYAEARVVYCQRVEKEKFAVGGELFHRKERGPNRTSSCGDHAGCSYLSGSWSWRFRPVVPLTS